MLRLRKINTIGIPRANNQETSLRIETRRPIIRRSTLIGRDQAAIPGRILGGVADWTAVLINTLGPINRGESTGQEIFPIGAIEYEEITIARSLQQQLLRRTAESRIH